MPQSVFVNVPQRQLKHGFQPLVAYVPVQPASGLRCFWSMKPADSIRGYSYNGLSPCNLLKTSESSIGLSTLQINKLAHYQILK